MTHSGVNGCGVDGEGALWCWGLGWAGSLGDRGGEPFEGGGPSVSDIRPSPIQVPIVDDVVDVASGGGATCAIDGVGRLSCWGHPAALGAPHDPQEPVVLAGPTDVTPQHRWIDLDSYYSMVAIRADGAICSWALGSERWCSALALSS